MGSVVVTGTSTGIGWGITNILMFSGLQEGRRGASHGVPLVFDVTDEDTRRRKALRPSVLLSPGHCWNFRATTSASRSTPI